MTVNGRCRTFAAALVFAALAAAPPARADITTQLISDISPYRGLGCSPDALVDSEHDQFLVVNPSDPQNLIAVWDQDDNAGTVAAYSFDGGTTWDRSLMPGLTSCTGEIPDDYSFDPWVSFGPDGVTYAIAALQDGDLPSVETPQSFAVGVNVSHDGGRTWRATQTIARLGLPFIVDKTTIRADPSVAGRAYATWTSILLVPGNSTNVISRTDDHGQTWSEPVTILAPLPDRAVFDSEIHVLPDGSLLGTYLEFPAQPLVLAGEFQEGPFFIKSVRSTDLGQTWTAPVTVAELNSGGLTDPDGGPALDGNPFQDVATTISPDGTVLVAWVDRSADPAARVLLSRSTDGGVHWDAAMTVAELATPAFIASVAAHPAGHWAATFYDLREDVAGTTEAFVSVWARETRDGGATWDEVKLGGPFDARLLEDHITSSPDWGDYFGLVPLPGGFGATFNLGPPLAQVGNTDVFFARLGS